jgi:hypothetical protein
MDTTIFSNGEMGETRKDGIMVFLLLSTAEMEPE